MKGRQVSTGVRKTASAFGLMLVFLAANANAASAGSISGTVTDPAGAPAATACATAYDASDLNNLVLAGSQPTTATGAYTFSGLAAGTYILRVEPCGAGDDLAPEWYENARSPQSATPLSVAADADLTGIDISLEFAGALGGTVTDLEDSAPIHGACVVATPVGGGDSFRTDARPDGTYDFSKIAVGDYILEFSDCHQRRYVTEYFDDKLTQAQANPVTIERGETSTASAALTPKGRISGTVTDDAGVPLEGCDAIASEVGGPRGNADTTDAQGDYTIPALDAASYVISFHCSTVPFARDEYYNDTYEYSEAVHIAVTDGSHTTGIDAEMLILAAISGTVRNSSGAPVRECVKVLDPSNPATYLGLATASDLGEWTIQVPPGQYKVSFEDCGFENNLIDQFYDDTYDFAQADLVTAVRGETTTGIDGVMRPWRSISGTVTHEDGQALEGICVRVHDPEQSPNEILHETTTDAEGDYSFTIEPGDYKVGFSECDSHTNVYDEFFDDAADYADATVVTLGALSDRDDIDAVMEDYLCDSWRENLGHARDELKTAKDELEKAEKELREAEESGKKRRIRAAKKAVAKAERELEREKEDFRFAQDKVDKFCP